MNNPFDQMFSYLAGEFSWEKLRQVRLLLWTNRAHGSLIGDLKGIADRGVSRWRAPVEPRPAKPLERAIFDPLGKERFSFVTFDKGHLQPSICAPTWIHVTSWWVPELNSYVRRSSPEIERLVQSLSPLSPSQKIPVHRVATVVAQWHEGEPQVRAWVTSRPGFESARAKLMASSMGDFDFTVRETQIFFGRASFPKREVSPLETSLLHGWLDQNPEKARVFQGEVANAWAQLPGHVAKEYSLEELCNALEEAGYRIPFIPEPEKENHADKTNG